MFGKFFNSIDLQEISPQEKGQIDQFMLLISDESRSWADPQDEYALKVLCGQLRAFGGDPYKAANSYKSAIAKSEIVFKNYIEHHKKFLPREKLEKWWSENPDQDPPEIERLFKLAHLNAQLVIKEFYVDHVLKACHSGS